jgi:hypothetical protein
VSFHLLRDDWLAVHVRANAGTALLADDEGMFYTASYPAGLQALSTLTSSVPHAAGFAADDGMIYLAGCDEQRLARIDPQNGFAGDIPTPCNFKKDDWTGGPIPVVRLDGSSFGAPLELFGLTRWDALIQYIDRSPNGIFSQSRLMYLSFVAWGGPGEAIHTDQGTHSFLSIRTDSANVVELKPDFEGSSADTSFDRARRLERGLAVAANTSGTASVLVRDDSTGNWHVLAQQSLDGSQIYDLKADKDGFVFAGSNGLGGWWSPSTGFCPAPRWTLLPADDCPMCRVDFYEVVPIDDDDLLISGFLNDPTRNPLGHTPTRVWWIHRSP